MGYSLKAMNSGMKFTHSWPSSDLEMMEKTIPHVFEDREFSIPADYDTYLRGCYGDYMQLPPEEDQVARHNAVFIDLNNSYTKYKGIHYCVEK